jgi:hypothetical protein
MMIDLFAASIAAFMFVVICLIAMWYGYFQGYSDARDDLIH